MMVNDSLDTLHRLDAKAYASRDTLVRRLRPSFRYVHLQRISGQELCGRSLSSLPHSLQCRRPDFHSLLLGLGQSIGLVQMNG